MTDERRYADEDVRAIFEAAATPRQLPHGTRAAADGLTLVQLQSIGQEVGLEPQRITEAAALLDLRRSVLPRRTSLGMPVAVGRVVRLPRAPTDAEWEQLVAGLRSTFDAPGTVRVQGGLRSWSNGNLQAFVEPGSAGPQLRLRTRKGDAAGLNVLAGMALFVAVAVLLTQAVTGGVAEALKAILFAVVGVTALGANALRLSRWAGEREAQMEQVAMQATALLSAPAGDPAGAREAAPQR